jgi:hypothetical protein
VELHQRALKAFSDRKSHAFSRELGVSEECMTNQAEVELVTAIDVFDLNIEMCDTNMEDGVNKIECDFDDFTLDSVACTNAGGEVNKIDYELECSDLHYKLFNYPHCLHVSCDAEEYYQMGGDEDCKYTVSVTESGAASEQCMTNQAEVQLTGINDLDEIAFDEMCHMEKIDGVEKIECDFDDLEFDSVACTSAGGQVNKVYGEIECSEYSNKQFNIPHCLHVSCDAKEYYQMREDESQSEFDNGDDEWLDCKYTLSGAAIGSTSILRSIALVSLFAAMLW